MQNSIIEPISGGGHHRTLAGEGFTLAEVLITLGIIGVVASLTIPNVIAGYEKQVTISKLQKVSSILNQAFRFSEIDNGESVYWNIDSNKATEYFSKYYKPYLKILHICDNENQCGYKSNTPWYRANGKRDIIHAVLKNWRESVILSDGTFMSVFTSAGFDSSANGDDNTYTEGASNLILIDINGGGKPNKFGRDVFYFLFVSGKGILPHGYNDGIDVINDDCSKDNFGYKCAAKIMRDGWKINDDYPW